MRIYIGRLSLFPEGPRKSSSDLKVSATSDDPSKGVDLRHRKCSRGKALESDLKR
jgi:hypothetical protein